MQGKNYNHEENAMKFCIFECLKSISKLLYAINMVIYVCSRVFMYACNVCVYVIEHDSV